MSRSDVRKSKSTVRSYFKKCKDALYGHANEETCTVTVNEDLPQSSNTSWYLATESNDSANETILYQLPKAIKTNQVDEQEAIDKEIKCMSMTETEPLVESQVNKVTWKRRKFRNCKQFVCKRKLSTILTFKTEDLFAEHFWSRKFKLTRYWLLYEIIVSQPWLDMLCERNNFSELMYRNNFNRKKWIMPFEVSSLSIYNFFLWSLLFTYVTA